MKIEDVRVGMILIRTSQGQAPWEAVGLEMLVDDVSPSQIPRGHVTGHGAHSWAPCNCRPKVLKGTRLNYIGCKLPHATAHSDEDAGRALIRFEGDAEALSHDVTKFEIINDATQVAAFKSRIIAADADDHNHRALLAFFSTPATPNTCRKCAAPTPCKYHE